MLLSNRRMQVTRLHLYILFTALLLPNLSAQDKEARMQVYQLMSRQNYSQAVSLLTDMIRRDSMNAELHINLGLALHGLHKYNDAIDEFNRAALAGGESVEIRLMKSKTYLALGREEEAETELLAARKTDSSNTRVAEQLADLSFEKMQFDAAASYYRRLAATDSTQNYYFTRLGLCALKSDTAELAVDYFRTALKIQPGDAVAANQLIISLIKLNQLDSALLVAKTASLLYPRIPQFTVLKGDIYFKQKMMFEAKEQFNLAIGRGDSSAVMLQKYGLALYMYTVRNDSIPINNKLINYQTAYEVLLASDRKSPNNGITKLYLGMVSDGLGEWNRAVDYCNQALEIFKIPFVPEAYKQLGKSYFNLRKYYDALRSYNSALQYKPDDGDLLYTIAVLAEDQFNDYTGALAAYTHLAEVSKNRDNIFQEMVQTRIKQLEEKIAAGRK